MRRDFRTIGSTNVSGTKYRIHAGDAMVLLQLFSVVFSI
jgi:hypothetical protein